VHDGNNLKECSNDAKASAFLYIACQEGVLTQRNNHVKFTKKINKICMNFHKILLKFTKIRMNFQLTNFFGEFNMIFSLSAA
jgi:hypothetical protein